MTWKSKRMVLTVHYRRVASVCNSGSACTSKTRKISNIKCLLIDGINWMHQNNWYVCRNHFKSNSPKWSSDSSHIDVARLSNDVTQRRVRRLFSSKLTGKTQRKDLIEINFKCYKKIICCRNGSPLCWMRAGKAKRNTLAGTRKDAHTRCRSRRVESMSKSWRV